MFFCYCVNNKNKNITNKQIYLPYFFLTHLEQGSANYSLGPKASLLSIFVNKVLLEHRYAYLFMWKSPFCHLAQSGITPLIYLSLCSPRVKN